MVCDEDESQVTQCSNVLVSLDSTYVYIVECMLLMWEYIGHPI